MKRIKGFTRAVAPPISGVLALAGLLLGCGGAPGGSEPAAAPSAAPVAAAELATMATLAASEATHAQLQVATWATFENAQGRFVLALDEHHGELARLTPRLTDHPDEVELTGISPDVGTVRVTKAGAVSGDGNDRLRKLAAALAADSVAGGPFQPPSSASASAGRIAPEAINLGHWGTLYLGWDLWGYDRVELVGDRCISGLRESSDAHVYTGDGYCSSYGWVSPSDSHDCRMYVHIHQYPTKTGSCLWQTFENTCSHQTCTTGERLASDCSPCAASVCRTDPYCCDNAWDSICVGETKTLCGVTGC